MGAKRKHCQWSVEAGRRLTTLSRPLSEAGSLSHYGAMSPARPSSPPLVSAASERNREPILAVLKTVLPSQGSVLEIAAGTGTHAAYFSQHLPALRWIPSDVDEQSFESIRAWRKQLAAQRVTNLEEPVVLDASAARWPVTEADAIFNANMVHISPWEVTEGLMRGAGHLLGPGSPLVLYGPFRVGGQHTAISNQEFDDYLRSCDPRWGIRDLEEIERQASGCGFELRQKIEMPANNLTLVFVRTT